MHGVYFHSSAVLTPFMNMKRRTLENCLSSDGKIFQGVQSGYTVLYLLLSAVADVYLSRNSSVSGNHLCEYRTGLHCLEIAVMPEPPQNTSNSVTESNKINAEASK